MVSFFTEAQARELCADEYHNQVNTPDVQELIDEGRIQRLEGFRVRPGKVSDCIWGGFEVDGHTNPDLISEEGEPIRLMIKTPRLSAGDKVRGKIPFKDQVLALNHRFMKAIVEQYLGGSEWEIGGNPLSSPVTFAENMAMIQFENVMRMYMAVTGSKTSLYQAYWKGGQREFCGYQFPDDLQPNGRLPELVFTPSTKSDTSDKSIGPQYLFERGIVTPDEFDEIKKESTDAFNAVYKHALAQGLLLVDTKLEHGRDRKGKRSVIDELFTLDSSRYVEEDEWKAKQGQDVRLEEYSKEFARAMVDGDNIFTREQCIAIGARYIVSVQRLLGQPFVPDTRPRADAIVEDVNRGLDYVLKTFP